MRRKLVIVFVGILFLLLLSWFGTTLTEILPARPSEQVQSAMAGPYEVTLRVDPNPPPIAKPALLTLQVVRSSTRQLITNAHITVESSMEAMDMGTDVANAQSQNNGMYRISVQFAMNGSWRIRVVVAVSGVKIENATFEVVAH